MSHRTDPQAESAFRRADGADAAWDDICAMARRLAQRLAERGASPTPPDSESSECAEHGNTGEALNTTWELPICPSQDRPFFTASRRSSS